MVEPVVFFLLILALAIVDIRAMKKQHLKREIIPYLVLAAVAAFIGIVYYQNPYSQSIASFLVRLLNL